MRKTQIFIYYSFLALNCKEPKPPETSTEKEFVPKFEYAAFLEGLTRACVETKPMVTEVKNPGFTQIIETSPYMGPTEKEYPTLSAHTRLRIYAEAQDDNKPGSVYFIRDNSTIVLQLQAGELYCGFPYQKPVLGDTIQILNRAAMKPKSKTKRLN